MLHNCVRPPCDRGRAVDLCITDSSVSDHLQPKLPAPSGRVSRDEQDPAPMSPMLLNSTLESTISENSHLNLSQRTCLDNLSALISNLSVLKRRDSELLNQLIVVKKKYRSVNETKTRICELLTSRRGEHTCPQNWIGNVDRCYFISSLEKPYAGAREHCSNFDARLLEINSDQEENFIAISIASGPGIYWIGKCGEG
ncbi:oxidized low-density lipoprotein receptor 1-like [Hypanus sabinus]|uniref:oxidized low-density lipoprotein receptor 1-like n=1 Tax=Hypanus sabinus TaxID=79690 RepID=UPI0028C484E4|nr:oxidized low-density lipoprotein receptor 1-like [Hypanus sabinus]